MINLKNLLALTILSAGIAQAAVITDFDETKIQVPFKDSNEEFLQGTICKTREHLRWDVCFDKFDNGDEQMRSFNVANWGENKIVPKSGFGVGRTFEFMFEDFARSDMGLLVWDSPDEVESHGHLKLMMFFPRTILPSIRYVTDTDKDQVIVTLPTKEEVVFNGKTYEIAGGVLNESPVQQDDEGNALSPGFSYQGSGVMIEADRLNDYPVGFAAQNGKNNSTTIHKKGFKDCKVPVKELWYTDDAKGGNVFFNKKYVTDRAFDQFLKTRCKFSMY
jgi:hypothetical protein